jgi:hypothetical protein
MTLRGALRRGSGIESRSHVPVMNLMEKAFGA